MYVNDSELYESTNLQTFFVNEAIEMSAAVQRLISDILNTSYFFLNK